MLINVFSCFVRSLGGKPGSVGLRKDKQNLIGISIGGGAPLCPCLYVVQVFDNTPAAKDGTLQAGDEIVGVNGKSMRGKTKVDVARAIQAIKVSMYCIHIHINIIVTTIVCAPNPFTSKTQCPTISP